MPAFGSVPGSKPAIAALAMSMSVLGQGVAWAQDGPPPPTAASAPHPHHPTTHRHWVRRHRLASTAPATSATPAPVPRPSYTAAPTPNANLLPPSGYVPPATSVEPGTMQLHYPPSGEGYVTGSSPQAMDDARTAKVPGVTLHVPLQPPGPQPLPPPQGPGP